MDRWESAKPTSEERRLAKRGRNGLFPKKGDMCVERKRTRVKCLKFREREGDPSKCDGNYGAFPFRSLTEEEVGTTSDKSGRYTQNLCVLGRPKQRKGGQDKKKRSEERANQKPSRAQVLSAFRSRPLVAHSLILFSLFCVRLHGIRLSVAHSPLVWPATGYHRVPPPSK